jgi:predicted phage tail component-like protein
MPSGKGYTITYNGVASTTIPELICHEIRRNLVGKIRDSFEEVAGMEGAWHFSEKKGMKEITLPLSVLAASYPVTRRATVEAVADWLDVGVLSKLITSDQPDRYDMAVMSTAANVQEWRERGTFEVHMLAYPYSYELNVRNVTNSTTGSGWSTTFDTLCKVPTYPVFEITPVGAGITGFTITTNGRVFTYAGAVSAGNTITVSSLSYTVHTGTNADTDLQGVWNPATLSMTTVSGKFPILTQSGVNTVVVAPITGAPSSMSVKMYWRKRFRS